jgi:hypothetical protein
MSSLADLEKQLRALMGASTKFYPYRKPQLDDYYEAYLWAETIHAAQAELWRVDFVNAGAAKDEFTFRMGPGLLTSKATYTYATLWDQGFRYGELHIGIRVRGESGVLHEFDVVALNRREAALARTAGQEPTHGATRLHIEAKFHRNDLSLGVGRGIVGLRMDCPTVHAFLVSRAKGSDTLRRLIKHHGGTYVHNVFPTNTGVGYLRSCLAAALARWKP